MKNFGVIRRWRGCIFGACLTVLSLNASAQWSLNTAKVVDSYAGCTWTNNGDGTSTVHVDFNYRSAKGATGNHSFWSRGILIYRYDANGKLRPSSAVAKYVTINGVKSGERPYEGNGYVMYNKLGTVSPEWQNQEPYVARVEALINNSVIKEWPGISIRAGNFTSGSDVGEETGGVYVTAVSGASTCKVIDPGVPPPEPPATLAVDVVAPDWNLGELQGGDDEKTLAGAEQQLCFTYTGLESGTRNFVINATSANGVSGNRYLLRNTIKPSQTVPYDLTLDSGSATFRLPNTSASPVLLNNNFRTCFVPTFRTSVDATVDAGDYSDVLSFTVVTKS